MVHLKRHIATRSGLVASLVVTLGCSGLGRGAAATATGWISDQEHHFGADAFHPPEFGLPEPSHGRVVYSATTTILGTRIDTVQYHLTEGDPGPLVDWYADWMRSAGLEVQLADDGAIGTSPDQQWSVFVHPTESGTALSLNTRTGS